MNQMMITTNKGLSRIIQLQPILSTTQFQFGELEKITVGVGNEFSIHFNQQEYHSDRFEVVEIQEHQDEVKKQIAVHLHHEDMDVVCVYQAQTDKPFLKKWLEITFYRTGVLERISVESLAMPANTHYKVAKSSGGFDICLFLSTKRWELFFTLDFPYNDMTIEPDHFEVSYPPYQRVTAGEKVRSHTLTVGSYSPRGIAQGDYDLGQAEAFRHYLLFDYAPPRLQAPQLVYTSIVNQYTEVNFDVPDTPRGQFPIQNKIFYTLTNAPYLMLYPERIPEEIDFCKEVSMEFCQIYEGPFEWTDETPDEETLLKISAYARKAGIKLGLYTGANNLTAAHFNHYGEQKGRPEWRMIDADGKTLSSYCFGSDEFTQWFTDTIIHASRTYGFLMTNFDFLTIALCYAKNHDHPPGGIYQQVANVTKCLNDIRTAVEGYVFDSNLGWTPLIPKIACEMDGFYFTDPYVNTYFPALNATKIQDDSRRADMVRYFRDYLTPVEYFRNCEYFVCADSVVHDFSLFEYGILQGLAVTPNLQLGESRALFDRLNHKQCEHARKFLAEWTQFVKDNWEYYHYTKVLTGLPSVGQVEIYAHCKAKQGYVFLVNPNPFRLSTQFTLDESIGLSSSGDFTVKELYPEKDCLPAIGRLPHKKYGDIVQYILEAQSCIVLAIEPANSGDSAQLFGLPAHLHKIPEGYQTTLSYFQGHNKQLVLQLLPNETVEAIYVDGKEIPFSQKYNLCQFDVTFQKGKVEPEIRQWVIREGSLDSGLSQNFHSGIEGDTVMFPVLENFLSRDDASHYRASLDALCLSLPATFLGAFIENLLKEKYPLALKILIQKETKSQTGEIMLEQNMPTSPIESAPFRRARDSFGRFSTSLLPNQREFFQANYTEFWLSSQFEVPFVQRYIPPGYYQHNFIMLNFLKPEQIKKIRAWINGKEVVVNRYDYWRGNEGSFTYYLDGTRSSLQSGKNTLVLWVSS